MLQEGSLMSNIILNLLAILTLLVFIGVIYAIVYASIIFIFSHGNEEKRNKARLSIRYAILGFILTMIILVAIPGFLRAIKVPGYNQYTSSNIFKTAKIWVKNIVNVFQNTNTPIDIDSNNYNL